MKKDDLLRFCRYYRGENKCPAPVIEKSESMIFQFWEAEQMYVNNSDSEFEKEVVAQYLEAGLASANLDLPLFLSACLFAVFKKGSENDLKLTAAYYIKNFLPAYLGFTSK